MPLMARVLKSSTFQAPAGAGADFLALNEVFSSSKLAALIDSVPVPV